jgi:hypothetical protein
VVGWTKNPNRVTLMGRPSWVDFETSVVVPQVG